MYPEVKLCNKFIHAVIKHPCFFLNIDPRIVTKSAVFGYISNRIIGNNNVRSVSVEQRGTMHCVIISMLHKNAKQTCTVGVFALYCPVTCSFTYVPDELAW